MISAVITCLTAGCSNIDVDNISPILSGFQCDFSIEDSELSGSLTVQNDNAVTFEFSGNDIINGLTLQVKDNTVTVYVNGITEAYSKAEVPDSSPAVYVFDALISAKQIKPVLKNELFSISGNSNSGKFELIIGTTGFIESVTLIKTNLKINFTNHSIVD